MNKPLKIRPFGDRGVLLEWENEIDPNINQQVSEFGEALEKAQIPGLLELVLSYQSITIIFDPLLTTYHEIKQAAEKLKPESERAETALNTRVHRIPVCYEQGYSLDMKEVLDQTGLQENELIKIHTSSNYKVYMTGFTPGFAYLGELPENLEVKRKPSPRTHVPAGSIAIAGKQTGVYSLSSPGGWQIIGRTPLSLARLNDPDPFKIHAGDIVRFFSISKEDFENGSW